MGAPRDEAFLRLLALAGESGRARVDLIVALAQRELFVPTWMPGDSAFRTVFSSAGVSALPVYATQAELEEMSQRFGWMTPDGRAPHRKVAANVVINHALAQNLLLIVDMGADHALELDVEELRPVAANAASIVPGPFAASGKLSASLQDVVQRRTPPPPKPSSSPGVISSPGTLSSPFGTAHFATLPPGSETKPMVKLPPSDARQYDSVPPEGPRTVTLANGVEIGSVAEPPEELIDALCDVLRAYPEVEWACLANVAKPPTSAAPTIGLRVASNFRGRVAEITAALKAAATSEHATLDVMLLDDTAAVRAARSVGKPFFPWRK